MEEEASILRFLFHGLTTRKSGLEKHKLYFKRWAILILYFLYNVVGLVHTVEYSVITDVVIKYYSVSYEMIYWITFILALLCIFLSIPGSYFLDKLGLRVTLLTGLTVMCAGAWVKVASVEPSRFWMFILGQAIIATPQVIILPTILKVAAVWFGPNEAFFACGIGIASIQLGIAVGILIPPLIVKQGDVKAMEKDLHNIAYGTAICTTLFIYFIYFYFDDAPPSPPSIAQSKMQENKISFDYYKSELLKLFKNKSFVLLAIVQGVNIGLITSIVILLNQIISAVYPDSSKDVGIIRLVIMCTGAIGTAILGCLIAKFGKLKIISMIVYISALFSIVLFLFLFNRGLIYAYVLATFVSLFLNGTFYIGFELAAELTYPAPVGAVGGIITISSGIFTVIMTYLFLYFFSNISTLSANLCLVILLLLADALLIFVELDFKRKAVEEEAKIETDSIDIVVNINTSVDE